jgi:predicted DNA-binding protein
VVPVDDAHALTLRLEPDLYERLRLLAFKRRVSLASIIREGTEARLAELEAETAAGDG